MAIFIKTLQQKRGDEFVNDLSNRFFPSIGFPPEKVPEFTTQLTSAPEYVISHSLYTLQLNLLHWYSGKSFRKVGTVSMTLIKCFTDVGSVQYFNPLMSDLKKAINASRNGLS